MNFKIDFVSRRSTIPITISGGRLLSSCCSTNDSKENDSDVSDSDEDEFVEESIKVNKKRFVNIRIALSLFGLGTLFFLVPLFFSCSNDQYITILESHAL